MMTGSSSSQFLIGKIEVEPLAPLSVIKHYIWPFVKEYRAYCPKNDRQWICASLPGTRSDPSICTRFLADAVPKQGVDEVFGRFCPAVSKYPISAPQSRRPKMRESLPSAHPRSTYPRHGTTLGESVTACGFARRFTKTGAHTAGPSRTPAPTGVKQPVSINCSRPFVGDGVPDIPAAAAKGKVPPPANPHKPGRERRPRRSAQQQPRHRTRSGESEPTRS